MTIQTSNKTPRLIPVPKWNDFHPYPAPGGLRGLVFHRETNGFSKVVKKVGRRVLIDEDAFFAWVAEQNANARRK